MVFLLKKKHNISMLTTIFPQGWTRLSQKKKLYHYETFPF